MQMGHEVQVINTFEVQASTTLYWKQVPFTLKQKEREDQSEDFTVRILSGYTKNNHHLKVLKVYVSSEKNLEFLHTLEVNEDEFQGLKNEQGILVDFGNFPCKIISLLEKCIESKKAGNMRFQAELITTSNELNYSILKIIETNDFNKLSHIILNFQQGNDISIKEFLAFRLSEVKENCENLKNKLKNENDENECLKGILEKLENENLVLKNKNEKLSMEAKAEEKRILIESEERLHIEKSNLKESLEKDKQISEIKLREQIESLLKRNEELDENNKKIREAKFELDGKYSEISHNLASSEGLCISLKDEVKKLKNENEKLNNETHELKIKLNELNSENRSNGEKVKSCEEIIEQQKSHMRDMENNNKQLELRCEELKNTSMTQDHATKEIKTELQKANQIIQKFANDLRIAKEKQAHMRAILSRQEDTVNSQQQAISQFTDEKRQFQIKIQDLESEKTSLTHELTNVKTRLDDTSRILKENEQMIKWLNKQVNEVQLQSNSISKSSRMAFHSLNSNSLSRILESKTNSNCTTTTDLIRSKYKSFQDIDNE